MSSLMSELSEFAFRYQDRVNRRSDVAARAVVRLWRQVQSGSLDAGWDAVAPQIERVMERAQVDAAAMAGPYVGRALALQGVDSAPARVVPEAFAGVTREGRAVVPELFAGVTTAKTLIGSGVGVGAAFQAGTAVMSVLAATIIRDSGRGAVSTVNAARGGVRVIRVVSSGACSRCAILAGTDRFNAHFERHPSCRCTSIPVADGDALADGLFDGPSSYFDSLSEAEQDRVFTKSGAAAIRAGADPARVVNARRGTLKRPKLADGTYGRGRLMPQTIGVRADGSPLQVFATPEGTTARSAWARAQGDLRKTSGRYRQTMMVRLMPEQIMQMSTDPARVTELLKRYGYIY